MPHQNVDFAATPGAAAMFENAVRATSGNASGKTRVSPFAATQSAAPRQRYDGLSRFLHWTIALGIIYTMIVGYSLHFISNEGTYAFLSTMNMSVATLVGALMIVRYVWRFFRPAVPFDDHVTATQKSTIRMAHDLFYIIIFLVLISGFLMVHHGFQLFFLIDVPRIVTVDAVNDFFFMVHRASCIALALMLGLHLAAVVKHQLMDKYPILSRMV